MPFSDIVDLRATVRNHLSLTTEVTDTIIDDWIRLCEGDLNRRLRVLDRQETTDLTIATETVETPHNFRGPVDLYLTATPRRRVRLASEDAVKVMQAVRATGTPRLYAVMGDSDVTEGKVLVFGPVPDQSYTGHLTFWKSFTVQAGGGGADLLKRWPDAWLYGTLIHAHSYFGNEPQVPAVEEKYLEAVAGIIAEDNESRYGVGSAA